MVTTRVIPEGQGSSSYFISVKYINIYQVSKIRYPRQRLVDGELEGDGCENKGEAQSEAILWKIGINCKCHKCQARDQELDKIGKKSSIEYSSFLFF